MEKWNEENEKLLKLKNKLLDNGRTVHDATTDVFASFLSGDGRLKPKKGVQ